uniref:Lipoprotein n=1 Tax=Arundo donax TaxID=35708 RepID=A0A0A9FZM7_ARUDO
MSLHRSTTPGKRLAASIAAACGAMASCANLCTLSLNCRR